MGARNSPPPPDSRAVSTARMKTPIGVGRVFYTRAHIIRVRMYSQARRAYLPRDHCRWTTTLGDPCDPLPPPRHAQRSSNPPCNVHTAAAVAATTAAMNGYDIHAYQLLHVMFYPHRPPAVQFGRTQSAPLQRSPRRVHGPHEDTDRCRPRVLHACTQYYTCTYIHTNDQTHPSVPTKQINLQFETKWVMIIRTACPLE